MTAEVNETADETGRIPPNGDSLRRVKHARSVLEQIIRQKLGNPLSFGDTNIRLRWQKGQLDLVETTDKADYK